MGVDGRSVLASEGHRRGLPQCHHQPVSCEKGPRWSQDLRVGADLRPNTSNCLARIYLRVLSAPQTQVPTELAVPVRAC